MCLEERGGNTCFSFRHKPMRYKHTSGDTCARYVAGQQTNSWNQIADMWGANNRW